MNFDDSRDIDPTKNVVSDETQKQPDDVTISANSEELKNKYKNIVCENLNSVDISNITKQISEKYSKEHNEELFLDLLDAIKKGNNRLVQHMLEQTLSVNFGWVEEIQDGILAMERIVLKPKLSLRDERELVKVERAKRVDSVAVRHLSTHTQYIKVIKDDGSVVPSTIMTRNLEEENAIYENRFLYALLQRMKSFVEKRYNVIVEFAKVKDNNALSYVSTFKYGKAEIDCKLNVGVKVEKELSQQSVDNAELIDKLKFIKEQILSIEATPFMQAMKKAKPVRPPIQRTNILTSNPEYATCYKLWVTLSNDNTSSYSVNAVEKQLPFDDAYFDDLTKIVATSAQVMLINNKIREAIYAQVNPSKAQTKEFKTKKNVSLLTNVFNSKKNANIKDIHDLYYEKMKAMILHLSNLADALSVTSENEIPKKALFKTVYNEVQKINNEMFEDILKIEFLETDKKQTNNLEEKIKIQSKIYERYKQLRELKANELNKAVQEEQNQLKKLKELSVKLEKQKLKEQEKVKQQKLLRQKQIWAKQKQEQKRKEIEKAKKLKEQQKEKARKQKEQQLLKQKQQKIRAREKLKQEKQKALLKEKEEKKRKALLLKKEREKEKQLKRQQQQAERKEQKRLEKEKMAKLAIENKQKLNLKSPKKKTSDVTKVHGLRVRYKDNKIISSNYDEVIKRKRKKKK